jgi:eukaryotic-like serine/threonine-protein kinase
MDFDCGSARDRLGRTLAEKYRLRQILGAGGTAVVYLASAPDEGTVAIKVLHDHLTRSEDVCRRFVREGELGGVLDHPSTVRVLDDGTTDEGCPYLVLEYLDGESLEERRVRSGGRLELGETLELCDQLLAVLEVAHAKNVIHRDIKPSNLFRTKSGLLKVLDFGIARLTDDTSSTSTKTGQTVGTPAFMPPEQALSRPREVDGRTDIWSVGATLFTLLSGEHVHIAESSSEHLVKAATSHARSLARALPGVPANVEALVARCLSFDKSDRWPNATAMREQLSFVREEPGRRIGTSTSPPPARGAVEPHVTLASSRPTVPDGVPSSASPVAKNIERTSETNMAITSNPGGYDLLRPRRKWLLPIAIGSTTGLVFMSVLVLVLAVRTTPPSRAAGHATFTPAATLSSPPHRSERAAPPSSVPETTNLEPKMASAIPDAAPNLPRVAATASASSTASSIKPIGARAPSSKTPPSRRDVYRPF